MSDQVRLGLNGNLHLVCAAHPTRGTYLAEQSFSAPIHLSKAYWDGTTLLVNVVNQTAGIFGGDRITTCVAVASGARVLLTSPSAARFHPSHGREARLEQSFKVGRGGSLDVFPEISIPQRGSRSFQKTLIEVEPGAELICLETLAPGRVAAGECFAFSQYAWSTEVYLGERLVYRERARIAPGDGSGLSGLTAVFPASYYAGFLVISPACENGSSDFSRVISTVGDDASARVAASRLCRGGWSIRILAADSLALRQCIGVVRKSIYQQWGRSVPDSRRT